MNQQKLETEEDNMMAKKNKKEFDIQIEEEQQMLETNHYNEPMVNYDTSAYSMFEGNGKYHVVKIPFNSVTLQNGNVEIVESNTEKLIIQERLQVLLFGADIL
jgi:hypothetical protein